MEKISWKDKINEGVLSRLREHKEFLPTAESFKLSAYFGHIVRHDYPPKTILTGRVEKKRGRGRPRVVNGH